ncbi:MAG: hypothetical protein ACLFT7_08660 [Thermoplasmata archaeon]
MAGEKIEKMKGALRRKNEQIKKLKDELENVKSSSDEKISFNTTDIEGYLFPSFIMIFLGFILVSFGYPRMIVARIAEGMGVGGVEVEMYILVVLMGGFLMTLGFILSIFGLYKNLR